MLNLSLTRNALYILPSLVIYCVFLLFPLMTSLGVSVTEWDGASQPIFVGLHNFIAIFNDPKFWVAIGNNVKLMGYYTILPIALGLALCSFLNEMKNPRELTALRILFFMPYIMPMAVLGVVWRWLYNPAFGPIDQFFRFIGMPSMAKAWLGDFDWALPATGLVAVWYFFGFCLVLFMSGIQRMDPSIHEASELDGSTHWKKFIRITLPALLPEVRVALILTVIASLKAFDLIYVMTQGGPGTSTLITNMYMYQQGFDLRHFGYASAVALVSMAIVFAVNGLLHFVLRERK
ncbi:raffinose/stachyose/melibiose transport system permease protein [Vibrio xiamenensis]|uniref:Raffinose/stachyose/melibiose transport system permease protein n=1 Tax=Vibrio xiamenensis TaxID=861298 RepID=A0A1G7X050_9VIBR|nr:sugar ABC transporter permease [Vibrio xiamenensis]SDG77521.1 raffinose/stachyose/melibiose transport system permease protein [Vibrio xiamenensis]SDG88931.1 raffinose/stachyose/melibiose transport system permease protein [Vibrio xiamenensis]